MLPAVSEPELRTLKREFLVRNGYLGPGSKPGADEFEICAPYGLMAVFTWTGGPDEAADEISAVIGIAKRFLVENSGLTGVTREETSSLKKQRCLREVAIRAWLNLLLRLTRV